MCLLSPETIRLTFPATASAKIGLSVKSGDKLAISEFPKWRKYLILLSFLDNSSARPVQIGGVDVNICHSRSTAVRGRRRSSSQSPPRGLFCRTRTGPVEADGAVDAQNAPTAPWKTLCVFHELPQGLSHQVTHEKLRKAPKYRWETRIDPETFVDVAGRAHRRSRLFVPWTSRVRCAPQPRLIQPVRRGALGDEGTDEDVGIKNDPHARRSPPRRSGRGCPVGHPAHCDP